MMKYTLYLISEDEHEENMLNAFPADFLLRTAEANGRDHSITLPELESITVIVGDETFLVEPDLENVVV